MTLTQELLLKNKNLMSPRTHEIFDTVYNELAVKTDKMLMYLMIFQWIVGVLFALYVSPLTWIGSQSYVNLHVYAAILIGGLLTAAPVAMVLFNPGAAFNRYVIAIAQMLFSVLFIHMSGGRIETHFHIFGSLAFLAFYRDWKVIVTATVVTAADHLLRGYIFPESVYGVLVATPWRALEHAGWVLFEDSILFISIHNAVTELRSVAAKQAELEATVASTEAKIRERTARLKKETQLVDLLQQIAFAANNASSTEAALRTTLQLICEGLGLQVGHALFKRPAQKDLKSSGIWMNPSGVDIAALQATTQDMIFTRGICLPGCVLAERHMVWMEDVAKNSTFVRNVGPASFEVRGAFAFPIFLEGYHLSAVLEFFSSKPLPIDPDVVAVLTSVGLQLGRLVERFRSQDLLASRAEELMKSHQTIQEQEHALVASAKTSALGEMAGQAAHEINTPLGAIVLTAEAMRKKVDQNQMDPKYFSNQLDLILKVTQKLSRIINSMRKLAGQGGNDLISEVTVGSLIEDTTLLCEGRFKKAGIIFEIKIDDISSRLVQCRPSEISQVLINLFNNSHDAITAIENRWVKLIGTEKDDHLEIRVADCGNGIAEPHRSKLFTPNFTTKSLNQGTGFGLSIARKIIERHNGKLLYDPNYGNTCFVIKLPWRQTEALIQIGKAV